MASWLPTSPHTDNSLLTCALCQRPLKDPKLLDCFHSFCLTCLIAQHQGQGHDQSQGQGQDDSTSKQVRKSQRLESYDENYYETVQCKDVTKSEPGYEAIKDCQAVAKNKSDDTKRKVIACPTCYTETLLPKGGIDDFQSDSLTTWLQIVNASVMQEERLCDNCEGKSVKYYCFDCVHYLCEKCYQLHGQMKITKHHTIIDLEDLQPLYASTYEYAYEIEDRSYEHLDHSRTLKHQY